MQLGYIHADQKEYADALHVLKMLSEPGAIDELGIGRIRDAFSDTMFPGTSTLQKHLKYFSLLPQLYKKATEKKYNRLSEVRGEIIELERIMTRKLVECSEDTRGITGVSMVDSPNFVKYDPVYIYNSGLLTLNILKSPQIYELIYATSKEIHAAPDRRRDKNDEDTADDAQEKAGLFQFCSFPDVKYDFIKECSLTLTPEDKNFIVEHVLTSEKCRGSLLRYIIDNPHLTLKGTFPGVPSDQLPEELATIQQLALDFSNFIYPVHLRYNWIYSKGTDEEILEEFRVALDVAKRVDIEKILKTVNINDKRTENFCRMIASYMKNDAWDELDKCIIRREKQVKGSRSKIDNPSYVYDKKNRIHYYKLSYRWETVSVFMKELGMEVVYG